jgi:hypothetical protein
MDPNPYESPQKVELQKPAGKVPVRRVGLAVALGLLAVPAAIIACFTTCLATYEATQSDNALIVGAVFGIAVAVTMIYLAVRAARGS